MRACVCVSIFMNVNLNNCRTNVKFLWKLKIHFFVCLTRKNKIIIWYFKIFLLS
jgi:hypothetical protein